MTNQRATAKLEVLTAIKRESSQRQKSVAFIQNGADSFLC